MITIGAGVGGGVIIDGSIYEGGEVSEAVSWDIWLL